MTRPAVTVVMPSFNQASFLREAIDSVLSQDYPDLDLLVMDGGSTDGSVAILDGYGDRLRYVSERDGGQSDAINRGFARAGGSIVAWLNSDDRYLPHAVTWAVAALQQHPEAAMAYGEGELIGVDGRFQRAFPANQAFDLWTLIHVSDYIMQPTVFMRADRVREVGGLDQSLHFAMDWDLWIKLACRWPVVFVPEPLAQTREHESTKTATGGFARLREIRRVLARHGAPGWPPAAIAYGLDTLRRNWPLVFGPSTLGDVERLRGRRGARIFRRIHRLVQHLIARQIDAAQGLWRDGWMAPRAFYALPWDGGQAVLRVRVEVPADLAHAPFVLRVRAAGREAAKRADSRSAEVRLPLRDASWPAGRPLEVELLADPASPSAAPGRVVSCLLREIVLEPHAVLMAGGAAANPGGTAIEAGGASPRDSPAR